MRALLFLCLLASRALADPILDESCAGTLHGHVVDATSHEPVVAASVTIDDAQVAITDDLGQFEVGHLCDGPLTVIVERDDYKKTEKRLVLAGKASLELELSTAGEVIEIHDKAPPPTTMQAEAKVDAVQLEKAKGKSFTAAIANVPGVTELRAATGVAKPIIRGQFGRRLLMLVDDVRHRSQEWGLEHAPEIDASIADAIRVVRGAGGVRYGSDAIGGVVLVDPPALRREPGYNGEAHLIGTSNGLGGSFSGRLQAVMDAIPDLSTQLEGSVTKKRAIETPNYPLQNAGSFEWNAGITAGFRGWKLSYRHYDAELGVCACLTVHDIDDFLAQAKAGRPNGADSYEADFSIDRPKQAVAHDLALARYHRDLANLGSMTLTYAFQHDRRREYDVVRNAATAGAQFNFRLMTHELDAIFEHNPIHLSEHWHIRGAAGVQGLGQIHKYSGLSLVPDYNAIGAGAYVTERLVGHETEVEAGVRYDYLARTASIEKIDFQRLVRSGQLDANACGTAIDPAKCSSKFNTFVGSVGAMQRMFGDAFSIKGDLSLASRAPNPDEQYLNGAAPTFPVLGLGKPDLKPETTYSSSITLAYNTTSIKAEASAFANLIKDYIYFGPAIGPDGMPIFDVTIRGAFPRFTTRPVDAAFWGADGGIEIAPIPALEFGAQASLVRAKNLTDERNPYLVFVPADHYRATATGHLGKSYATLIGSYVAKQTRYDLAADFVEPPKGYFLLGAELGTETCLAGQTTRFALQGSNLTNTRFRDYTSLMRYFADEPGWQVFLRMSFLFDSKKGQS